MRQSLYVQPPPIPPRPKTSKLYQPPRPTKERPQSAINYKPFKMPTNAQGVIGRPVDPTRGYTGYYPKFKNDA